MLLPLLIGWLAGVCVNYIAETVPYTRLLRRPICECCGQKQGWLAFMIWPRRCMACGTRRKLSTFGIELLFTALSLTIWTGTSNLVNYPLLMVLAVYFGVVFLVDVKHRIIMHETSAFGMVFGLYVGYSFYGLSSALVGGVVGLLSMLAAYLIALQWKKRLNSIKDSLSDEPLLGFGDVFLAGTLGLMVGWPGMFMAVTVSMYLGGLVGLGYLLVMAIAGKDTKGKMVLFPYAPFLIAGAALSLALTAPV